MHTVAALPSYKNATNPKAIVNEFNEEEAPHAHILKDGVRIAKVGIDGVITDAKKMTNELVRFVNKYKEDIIQGIKDYYPSKNWVK